MMTVLTMAMRRIISETVIEYVKSVSKEKLFGLLLGSAKHTLGASILWNLKKHHDHEVNALHIQDDLVNPAIFDEEFGIKSAAAAVTDEARDHVLQAIAHLRDRGAEAVILGCTELPLAVTEPHVGDVLAVDPTRALARALIREFAPEKLRPIEAVLKV